MQADALGGDLVVPDGHDGPALAAAHQVQNNEEGYHHQDEARREGGDGLDAHSALSALDDGGAGLAEVQVVGGLGAREVEEEVHAILIHAHDAP